MVSLGFGLREMQRNGTTSGAMSKTLLVFALMAAVGCHGGRSGAGATKAKDHLDFNQDVQPILASNCFSCHGPDPGARKAGLRLDFEEAAFAKRQGKPDAIVPGHPDLSEMIRRIESKDPHQRMPQSSEGEAKPMKPEEIAILKQWVAEGAHYRPHWAFEVPVRPTMPAAKEAVGNPIDGFVLARLEKEGLHPSPEADKRTLIRRVTLDLTGLLPTRQEVDAFLKDSSPQAYERVVDRLLASSAYGEQRTRYWMDYARYSDTYGLHHDNSRHIWAYRDYLIKAFQTNKPFDQFAKEQIAGDMMPAKNLDPIVASGYLRAGVSSNEGGAIPEELRVNIARERTEAYGAAFLGLTVGCAVCHDHKYDPTTQKDFYQLSAFFNNVNEKPFNEDMPDWAPVVRLPKAGSIDSFNQLLAKRSQYQEQLRTARLQEPGLVKHWLETKKALPQAVSTEKLEVRLRMDEGSGDVLKNSAPAANPRSFKVDGIPPQWGETTWLWPDLRMDTGTRISLGTEGDFDWMQPFSTGGWFMLRSAPNVPGWKLNGTLISKMDSTQQRRGWEMATDQGVVSVDIVNSEVQVSPKPVKKPTPPPTAKPVLKKAFVAKLKPPPPLVWPVIQGSAIRVSTANRVIEDGAWQHIFFTYDGSGRAAGVKIYVNGVAVPTRVLSDSLEERGIKTTVPMELGMRSPELHPARDTRFQDVRLYSRSLSNDEAKRLPYEDYVAEVIGKPASTWTKDQTHVVGDFYFASVDEAAKAASRQIRQLTAELESLTAGGDATMVSEERPTLAYADVLNRGVYSDRKERVEADTPHFLPRLPAGLPHNRLALAEWTVSGENPLTARVAVNRMWNELFGAGLVETTEDFGIMGQRPSNPALLDWLAVEFRESGWNVKHMYKLMVMSATYRQSAKSTPDQVAKDPKNLLLARGPRFRMDAEMLRDVALQSSGLLVTKVGGPSVKPYQPENVWETIGIGDTDTLIYAQDHGDALYRRSLYTYWKRMATEPNMDVFDAPMRDTACTRRQRTDTPLQALVTMNDPQWVEASRALAERVITEGGAGPEQRIGYLSELVLSRPPSAQMETVLQRSLKDMQKHYEADPEAARKLISVGEKPHKQGIPAPELAAWTMVASEVLNLDEALNK